MSLEDRQFRVEGKLHVLLLVLQIFEKMKWKS